MIEKSGQEKSMSITLPKLPLSMSIAHHHHHHHHHLVTHDMKKFKYMECLKNHAAAIGGSATDGCGEFMPGGEQGTLEALECSACNCHRNFHRKILIGMKSMYEVAAAEEGGGGRKRFRSKFSQYQKEKMQIFAEKSGWKIHKADDAELRSFCDEIGVNRKVLKVWMHNNKYNHLPNANANANASTSAT